MKINFKWPNTIQFKFKLLYILRLLEHKMWNILEFWKIHFISNVYALYINKQYVKTIIT